MSEHERVEVEGPNEHGALKLKHYVTERSGSEHFIPARWHDALLRALVEQAGGVEVEVCNGRLYRMNENGSLGEPVVMSARPALLLPLEGSE